MNNSQPQAEYKVPTQPVEITALGMVSPVGADAIMTAASVRSGISAYEASSVINKDFNPVVMALVPEDALPPLEDELKSQHLTARQQRMLRLCTPAMQQLADVLKTPMPLMLCGPEKLPGRRSVVSDTFLKQLQVQSKASFDLDNSYVFAEGRAAGFYALEVAIQLLESGHQQVMLGGVDSFLDLYLLATLDNDDRILAEGVMDAFVPGEAAVFMLLKLADEQSSVKIYPPGIADEPGHRYSSEPYKGDGLANAVRESLEKAPPVPVNTIMAGFNGEHFHAKEWGVAAIRNAAQIDSDFNMLHPADCYGDIGAATGPMLMALASMGLLDGYYRGPVLAWASSEIQQRAGVYIE